MKPGNVFLFSGQGSQYYHMGRELYARDPVFKQHMLALDEVAREFGGDSILAVLYDDQKSKAEVFSRTRYSHPAIFMLEYSLAQSLIARGVTPDYLFGSSLGEFVAAAVGGVHEADDILRLIIAYAREIENGCQPGAMLAILERSTIYHADPLINANATLVGVNFDQHFVVSGKRARIDELRAHLSGKGITHVELPVSHGFHSPALDSCHDACRQVYRMNAARRSRVPIVSSCHGRELEEFSRDYYWDVGRQPILFREALFRLLDQVPAKANFIDVGPAGTLAGFVRQNLGDRYDYQTHTILSPFADGWEQYQNLAGVLARPAGARRATGGTASMTGKEKDMIAWIFPGQGAQFKGMGRELFERFPEQVARADALLGYSIADLCLHDRDNRLGNTLYTQPALYVVNALACLAKREDEAREADFVAGHSLGEYSALFAAGMLDFETGLRLVTKRAQLMARARDGAMAAVIGLDDVTIARLLGQGGFNNIDVANFNSPGQIVISGDREEIVAAQSVFEEAGCARYVILPVSGAFHSRLMREAANEFADFLASVEFQPPRIPVISNVSARPYQLDQARRLLAEQIASPVKWVESIRYMWGQGVESFEELGPGRVLTGLVAKIKAESSPLPLEEQATQEPTEAVPDESPDARTGETESTADELARSDTSAVDMRAANMPGADTSEAKATEARDIRAAEAAAERTGIQAQALGSESFRRDHGLRYAYVAGGMVHGIHSVDMVVRLGRAGMLGYFGTGGLSEDAVEKAILDIQARLRPDQAYGMNLLHGSHEERNVDLFLKHGVRKVEAAAFMSISPALVRYRLNGLRGTSDGGVEIRNRVMAKLSRPEVARGFLAPAPEKIVADLLRQGAISAEQASLAERVLMADDICVESDSGGHTDHGVMSVLLPAFQSLRAELAADLPLVNSVRIGAAGGIGTPEAAAAAFVLGADFILTGSINQCTVQAGTSDAVKDMLQQINVQDTDYAPAGDMFELGARVQVLKRGVFFPARANKLYDLYRLYGSLDEIDEKTRTQIETRFFQRSFEQVYADCRAWYPRAEIERAEKNPKHKMALIFRWYFGYSNRLALAGDVSNKVDFQVHCGPSLGAFNQWVKDTPLASWRNRQVDEIGEKIMSATAELLERRIHALSAGSRV